MFQNITELKEYVGGAVNISVEIDSMSGAIYFAKETIKLHTGIKILERYEAGDLPDLKDYILRPLAYLAVFEYSKIAEVQLSESGVLRTENENFKTAYKYQSSGFRQTILRAAWESIEQLRIFLLAQKSKIEYSDWVSEIYEKEYRSLLNLAANFREATPISAFVFYQLKAKIEDIELFVGIGQVGEKQYSLLIENQDDIVSTHIRRAIAHFTIRDGLRQNWLTFNEQGRVVMENYTGNDASKQSTAATPLAMSTKIELHDYTANQYMSRAKDLMLADPKKYAEYIKFVDAKEQAELDKENLACAKNESTNVVQRW